MTYPNDLAYVEATIARLVIKLNTVKGEKSKFYYRACIRGWEATRDKLKAKGG